MKKMLLLFLLCLTLPFVLSAQEVIESFDAELDSAYFATESSANSDSLKSFTVVTTVTDPVAVGAGAIKVDYSAENIESWGGYTKIEHVLPADGGLYDWSEFDSISFWYYNVTKQNLPGRVHVRFELYDASNVPDTTTNAGQMEFYYSFQYILDDEPGWKEFKLPLVNDPGAWNGEAFNRTGWAGIPGNDFLDKDKIKGWAWEFSISGNGSGDVGFGTIVFDHLTLKGSKSIMTLNPGFEDGALTVWSSAHGGTGYIEVKQGNAYAGDYYCEIGVTDNQWAVAWQDSFPAGQKENWKLSAWVKDFSAENPGGDFAAMKIEPKDANFNNIGAVPDVILPGVTNEWQKFSIYKVLPEGTVWVTATLVASKWSGDGKSAAYGFDNVSLAKVGEVDDIPPEAPQNVSAAPNPGGGYNVITWDDVPGEVGETYTVYASKTEISDVTAAGVEKVATVVEDLEQAIHYIHYPLKDKEVTYYYAVICSDASLNQSEISGFGPLSNIATGIPTISLNPPEDFEADGDISEWLSTDIMPFRFTKSLGTHFPQGGSFDDDADLDATAYIAVDDENLYLAFDVIDNVFSFDPLVGDFWMDDLVVVFIGLYNQTTIHNGFARGAEPDYRFNLIPDRFNHDQAGTNLYTNDDDNYEFIGDVGFANYSVEVKVPWDALLIGGCADDNPFEPKNGMKIPLDIEFHDSDEPNMRQGIYTYSPFNSDNSWQGVQNWFYTWIGDTNEIATALDDETTQIVTEFNLAQNYPNPFNPETTVEYSLATASKVNISVYNTVGQKVATLIDARQNAGIYQVKFTANDLPSGLYFYKIQAGDFVQTKKMLLVK